MNNWTPKSILALRAYSTEQLRHDLIAGVTVGLVALLARYGIDGLFMSTMMAGVR